MDTSTFWEKTKTVFNYIWKCLKQLWKGIKFVWNNSSSWLKAAYIFGGVILIAFIIGNDEKKPIEVQSKPESQESLLARLRLSFESKDSLDILEVIKYNSENEQYSSVSDSANQFMALLREEAAELNKHRAEVFKRLKSNHDSFDNVTWYKNPYFTHYNFSNNVSAYIGMSGRKIWMRMIVTYSGSDWIFFDECNIKFGNDLFPVVFNKYDKKTDVKGGHVYEMIDKPLEALEMSYLYGILPDNNEGQIRMSGKYQTTRNLTKNEIKGLRDILDAYIYLLSDGYEGEPLVIVPRESKNGPVEERYRRKIHNK